MTTCSVLHSEHNGMQKTIVDRKGKESMRAASTILHSEVSVSLDEEEEGPLSVSASPTH